ARPHHHPEGRARSHWADRIAAILDHHLGRATQQRNQLSHRVCRGAEQSAPRWLHNARGFARCLRCERQLPERRVLFSSTRLESPNRQCPLAGWPGLSLAPVVRRSKPMLVGARNDGTAGNCIKLSPSTLNAAVSALPQRVRIGDVPFNTGGRPGRTAMPRFYFHLSNCDEYFRDNTGYDLADIVVAHTRAKRLAHLVMTTSR